MIVLNRNFFVAVLVLFLINNSRAQESNYLNSTFAVVSAVYGFRCDNCDEVSRDLQTIMTENDIFSLDISGPNWLAAADKNELSKYRTDFFLTSKLSRKPRGYEIEFVLYDKDEKTYRSDNFRQFISEQELVNDIYKVAKLIIEEIDDFKANGQFKNVIQVVTFEIVLSEGTLSENFAKHFSDWLADELKKDREISVNYHVLAPDKENANSKNNLDGEFFQTGREAMNIIVKMELNMDGKTVRCSKITTHLIDYDSEENRKKILDEIIKRIDPDKWN